MHRDQRHHRRAGLCVVADVGAQVGDDTRAGASTFVRARVQFGFLDCRAGALHLRVVVAGLTSGLLRLAQIGLGAADLGPRFLAGRRALKTAHRDGAGILLVQVFLAGGVAFGHFAVRLRGRQWRAPRPRRRPTR